MIHRGHHRSTPKMFSFHQVLCFCILAHFVHVKAVSVSINNETRIIDGRRALEPVYRHLVAIGYADKSDDSYCSGTVIGRRWVLTSAHCFIGREAKDDKSIHDIYAYVGTSRNVMHTTTTAIKAKRVYVHDFYKPNGALYNDIAVIELSSPVSPMHVTRLTIAPTRNGVRSLIAGYGVIEENKNTSSKWARQAPVRHLNYNTCVANENTYKDGVDLSEHYNICALPNSRKQWKLPRRSTARMLNANGEGNLIKTGFCCKLIVHRIQNKPTLTSLTSPFS